MISAKNTFQLLPLVLLATLLIGCDSGGNSDDPLAGNVSYQLEGGSAQVSVSESYFYSTGDGFCQATRAHTSSSLPIEVDAEPEEVNCEGVEPGNYDGVRVTVSHLTGSMDLTLTLLSDGEVIDEASEPTSFGGGEAWIVEAGEIPDFSQ